MTVEIRGAHDVEALIDVLAPVRTALLDDADTEARRIVAEATHDADSTVAETEADANAEIERTRHRSQMSARARADQKLERLRAESHRDVLRAKDDIRRRLIDAVHDAVLDLRDDPRYPELLRGLEARCIAQLGPGASIERDPADGGGIVATADTRRLDYSLPALAERALDSLADDVAELWR